jgi:hypothetical protein
MSESFRRYFDLTDHHRRRPRLVPSEQSIGCPSQRPLIEDGKPVEADCRVHQSTALAAQRRQANGNELHVPQGPSQNRPTVPPHPSPIPPINHPL